MLPALKRLALVRIAVGVIFLLRTTPALSCLGLDWTEPGLWGHPDSGWHPVALGMSLPAAVLIGLAVVRTLSALAFTLGFHARLAGLAASACGYLALAQDPMRYVNSLHLLFLSTFLLALTDSQTTWALRRREPASARSSVWLIRGLVMSVYTFSGIAKLNADFLSGRSLVNNHADGIFTGGVARLVCASLGRAQVASILVTAFELGVPWLLFCRRTRWVALVGALVFHLTVEVTMHPDVFGWLMIALLAAFASTRRGASHSGGSPPGSAHAH